LNKRVLLGVTGGIAAYKGAELVRRLREQGAEVQVVMTRGAREFITPLTFQALSGKPVRTEIFSAGDEAAMGHIELARWADCVLIAPASANFIARLAAGLADDLLSTLCLASAAPIAIAPAMNQQMWNNPATCANVRVLKERGMNIFGPASGDQACGETGPGRMLEPGQLVEALAEFFKGEGRLCGRRVLITAGPTQEAIDPVRYISNRSSGRMGYALCAAALNVGAEVTLISGPVALQAPAGARVVQVRTALEMRQAVMAEAVQADIFIAAAAVADYRCADDAAIKIKKSATALNLRLEPNPDILAEVAALARAPFTVGFAAETESLREHALEKLEGKHLDMIAANLLGDGKGFESPDNALEVYWRGGERSLPLAAKERIATQLMELIAERYDKKNKN
ncbi:MAG TPA: bifunctional phosphopantothenoylcysteine decarboxylase/phosphopantothenate--cysteine ligase CoaBC, partial [Gammaproteobacteria bacterium]|nr:bifunctional phosphopantothenoylcysteine decarboxylase/phosphopantothenate--cysteine ligase CoaBC [Gammaproteobacteria bacterium]